jgi:penicillin-binding protein 1C
LTRPRVRKLALVFGLLLVLLALRVYPKPPLLEAQPWSRAVYASGGELLRLSLASDEQYRLWAPLKEISPAYVEAVLLYEDRGFYWHPGVNPLALLRSGYSTAFGTRRQGGSTITMQLARRLYRIESRSLGGKLKQIFAALWLEARYGKAEILEAYLNLTPFGGNVEGAGAASLIYFRKPVASLNLPESIALAVIPQNPRQRMVSESENSALQKARTRLWRQWLARHPGDGRLAADQQLVLQGFSRGGLPFEAPHVVDMLLRTTSATANGKPQGDLHTSLDLRMQHALERVVREYLRTKSESGVTNASALLLDARDMRVKALVGSADYYNAEIEGQVNGALAKRSPGSTLKPFIYALALDQGVLHPMSMLKDAPTSFGPFSPENFDGRFVGPITAQDALIRSRNIPAVAVAAKLGKPNLYDFLKMAGVSRMQSEEHYGLALVLGGGEVSMEELAQLYATLTNDGVWRPLGYLSGGEEGEGKGMRLLSEESSFITLDMLQKNVRPDTLAPARPAVAWKTGTSWSFRDAWTAGVFGHYVLVVWLGNFDGHNNPALIGIEAAAPLFLRIVDAIRAENLAPGEAPKPPPANLRKVEVCAASGDLPDDLCRVRASTWFIPGKSPIGRSRLHRAVWVDKLTGKPSCAPNANSESRIFEDWSSDIQRVFAQAGLPRRTAPADCETTSGESGGPRIASPLRGVSYTVRISKPEALMLRADAPGGVKTLFWFVDGEMVGRSKPGETMLWNAPVPKTFLVRVVDDAGRAESRELTVEFLP